MVRNIIIDKSESKLEDVSSEYYLERVGHVGHPMFIPLSAHDDRVELILGRNVCLSRHVSKKHASFWKSLHGSWFIKDLDSLNGIYKNKERIDSRCYMKLREGTHIGLGIDQKEEENEYYFIFKKKRNWIPSSEINSDSEEIIPARCDDENVGILDDYNVGSNTLNFDPTEPFFSELSEQDQIGSTSKIKKAPKNNASRVRMIEALSLKLKGLKKSLSKLDTNRFYVKRKAKVNKSKAKLKLKKKPDLKFKLQKLMGHRIPCPGGGSAIRTKS